MDIVSAMGLISPSAATAAGELARERLYALADQAQTALNNMNQGRVLVRNTQGHEWDSPTARHFDTAVMLHLERAQQTSEQLGNVVLALRAAGDDVQRQLEEIARALAVLERRMFEGLTEGLKALGRQGDAAAAIARGELPELFRSEELRALKTAYEKAQDLLPIPQLRRAALGAGV